MSFYTETSCVKRFPDYTYVYASVAVVLSPPGNVPQVSAAFATRSWQMRVVGELVVSLVGHYVKEFASSLQTDDTHLWTQGESGRRLLVKTASVIKNKFLLKRILVHTWVGICLVLSHFFQCASCFSKAAFLSVCLVFLHTHTQTHTDTQTHTHTKWILRAPNPHRPWAT